MTEVQQTPLDPYGALVRLEVAIRALKPALQLPSSRAKTVRIQPLCSERPVRAWRLGSAENRLPFCIDAEGTLYRIYKANSGDRKDESTVVSTTLKEDIAMTVRCTAAIHDLTAELLITSIDT